MADPVNSFRMEDRHESLLNLIINVDHMYRQNLQFVFVNKDPATIFPGGLYHNR
jgi:hypothetical protein